MLIGAHGSAARGRVEDALERLCPAAATELMVREELTVGWPRDDAPAVFEEGGRVCVLDGWLDSAPWLSAPGHGTEEREADRRTRASAHREARAALGAWTRSGEGFLEGARGSFVILMWQAEARRGLLARDPTGLRPLFRSERSGHLAFASEIVPLLATFERSPAPDPVTMAFWLSNDNCWDERTLFEGVAPLRGGHLLTLPEGARSERAWWYPRYRTPAPIDMEEATERVRGAIRRSIARHTPPVGEAGVLLSGGIDSTSVAALALAESGGPIERLTGYSLVFPRIPQTDESERIGEAARRLRIPSVRMAVGTGSPTAGILDSIADWGVPSISPNRYMMPPLLERARADGVRLLLGGEGGDDLFELSPMLIADRVRAGRLGGALELTRAIPGGDRQPLSRLLRMALRQAVLATAPIPALARARRPSGVWAFEPDWLDPGLAALHREASDPLRWRRLDGPRWWAYRAYVLYINRQVVSFSDEIRRVYARPWLDLHEPLLDPELVELILDLPPELAYSAAFDRPVLRTAVRGMLPEPVRTGTAKSNFIPVLIAGIGERDLQLARELLGGPDSRVRELTSERVVREQLLEGAPAAHPRGAGGWAVDILRLLSIECWLRAREDRAQLEELMMRVEPPPTSFHLEPAEPTG
jgi:asparagine synthase (glutamine-hydrolysing)